MKLKEYDWIWTKISAGERSKTFCLVATQSLNEGSLDTRTLKCSLLHQLCVDIVFIKTYGSDLSEKNLLLNESLTTPWTNMLCSKGRWNGRPFVLQVLPNSVDFLARSGEIGFEVIGHKQCGGLEVQCQLEFNCSNEIKVPMKWKFSPHNMKI